MEEEGRTKLEKQSMKKDEETKTIEAERRHAEEEERLRKEKMEAEENRKRKEQEERRMTEEKELKERERVRLEKEKMELEKTEKALKERMRREEERKLKAEQERIRQEKDEIEKQKKEKEQINTIERRPDVKPRSARMNAGMKTENTETASRFTNPLEESLLLDEISTSPFEQSKASAKVSAVRPRAHAVKPLSTIDNQPDFKDNFASAKIAEGAQVSMKAPDAKGTGPYSQLTHEELVNLLERQKEQLSQKDTKIMELEQYIDNLLVRVIEENPSILMSLTLMKKSV